MRTLLIPTIHQHAPTMRSCLQDLLCPTSCGIYTSADHPCNT
jgi:hypothetical protein